MYSTFKQDHSHSLYNLNKNRYQPSNDYDHYTCKLCNEQFVFACDKSSKGMFDRFHGYNQPSTKIQSKPTSQIENKTSQNPNQLKNLIKDKKQAYDGTTTYTCTLCGEKVITKPFWEMKKGTIEFQKYHSHTDPLYQSTSLHDCKQNLVYNSIQANDGRSRYTCTICKKQMYKPPSWEIQETNDHNHTSHDHTIKNNNLVLNKRQVKDNYTRYTCKICRQEVKFPVYLQQNQQFSSDGLINRC